jgi:hypothetical protein
MAKERFTWLAADTFTRSRDGAGGKHLIQGESYDVAGFSPAIVEEWVRAGAAEWATKAKKSKEE